MCPARSRRAPRSPARNDIRPALAATTIRRPSLLLLAGLVVALPLVVWPFGDNVYDIPKVVVLVVGTTALLLIGALAFARRPASDLPIPPTVATLGAALAGWLLVASALSLSPVQSFLWPSAVYWHLPVYVWLCCLGLLFATALVVRDRPSRRLVLRAWGATAALVSVYALLQSAGIDIYLYDVSAFDRVRAIATLGNPTVLGGYLVMALGVCLALVAEAERRAERVAWTAVSATSAGALLMTLTRSAWLGTVALFAAAALALLVLPGLRREPRVRPVLVTMGVLVVLVVAAGSFTSGQASVIERVRSTLTVGGIDASAAQRLEVWGNTLRLISERPLAGWGPGTFADSYPRALPSGLTRAQTPDALPDHPHDQLLDLAATAGWPAAALYALLLGSVLLLAARSLPGLPSEEQVSMVLLSAASFGYTVHQVFLFDTAGVTPLLMIALGIVGAGAAKGRPGLAVPEAWMRLAPIGPWLAGALMAASVAAGGVALYADTTYQRGLELGRTERAGKAFLDSSRLQPFEASYRLAFARLAVQRSVGDVAALDAAEALLRQGLATGVSKMGYHDSLGQVLLSRPMTEPSGLRNAESEFREALAGNPYLPSARFGLGETLLASGRAAEALQEFTFITRTTSAFDTNGRFHYDLGTAYEGVGDTAEAAKAYRAAVEADPGQFMYREALDRVSPDERRK